LVAPLLGGVFVLLLYVVGREMAGPAVGLMAAALAVISPVARVIFGSMMSHAAAATLILAALWLVLVARRLKSWPATVAAGIALGLAFGVRPLSAVAIALPIGALLVLDLEPAVLRRSAQQRLVGFAAGGCLGAAPALLANSFITGSAFAFPYSLYGKGMYLTENIPFGLRNLDVLLASTGSSLYGWGWEIFHGPIVGAVTLALALIPFLMGRQRSYDLLLGAMVVCVLVLHLGTRGHGLHGFGPRYYFEIFACLFLLTARGFQELGRMGGSSRLVERRIPVAAAGLLFFALCMPAGAILPHRLELYRGYNGVDGTLEEQVVSAQLERALILLPTGDWRGWAMASRLMKPGSEAALLFLQADPDDPAITEIAGDREIFVWRDGCLEQADK
jgi:4-amino-4-deoxy-L-arabinose transferase-like glycosyltransferase